MKGSESDPDTNAELRSMPKIYFGLLLGGELVMCVK